MGNNDHKNGAIDSLDQCKQEIIDHFDQFKEEISKKIDRSKNHTIAWVVGMGLLQILITFLFL